MSKKENEKNELLFEIDYLQTASCQDCTGLIPVGSLTDDEMENYEELYPFLPQAIHKKN